MARKTSTKRPTAQEMEKIARPYLMALGRVAFTWNGLQDSLAFLFWKALGISNGGVAMAIWQSVQSDKSQRDMLRAAVRKTALWHLNFPKATEDIEWLLAETDKLSNKRNDALHAPFGMTTQETGEISLELWTFTLSLRAANLRGKHVLEEFDRYANTAVKLHAYSKTLFAALASPPQIAWPERPLLPTSRQTSGSQSRRFPTKNK